MLIAIKTADLFSLSVSFHPSFGRFQPFYNHLCLSIYPTACLSEIAYCHYCASSIPIRLMSQEVKLGIFKNQDEVLQFNMLLSGNAVVWNVKNAIL